MKKTKVLNLHKC